MSDFETLFDSDFCIDKPIRLIELFGGIGSQAMALRDIGADFEHYRLVEFDKYAVASYNAIHRTSFDIICCVLIIAENERIDIEQALLKCIEKNRKRAEGTGDKK